MEKPLKAAGIHIVLFGILWVFAVYGCPVYRLFGIRCPGCGLTRAWVLALHGRWWEAVSMNPVFLPAPLFVFLYAHKDIPVFRGKCMFDAFLYGFAVLAFVCYMLRIWL